MILSPPVLFLLSRLSSAGFSAYAVGGCVRDSLLGKQPHDWDLCTNALPDQIKEVFSSGASGRYRFEARNGDRYPGSQSIRNHYIPYGRRLFRITGILISVSYVDRVDEDLARRDFTINAHGHRFRQKFWTFSAERRISRKGSYAA